ncbi:unnamed protein product [Adineta ricciae]|uniref:EF-hand domain-containing protein n=1 Tax=Adineta ricciae TaxID=249248 RepID=A0A813QC54_ADIRI|nr:unnamed protein product [Adineta ricciae]
MDDTDDIAEIFQLVDSDGSGYLNKDKLHSICPHLSSAEIDVIFNDLDTDHDNRISFAEFTSGFKDLIKSNDNHRSLYKKKLLNHENALDNDDDGEEDLTSHTTQIQINEVFNNLSCQEQIYDFYQTIRNVSSESVEQFQSILEVFVCDIVKYRKEVRRLEDSYRREKEMNEKYLRRIEEDQEREMRQLEEKVRKEEQHKFESIRESIQERANKQISDLQANVQRLQSIEQCYLQRQSSEDASLVLLREEISKLTQENQTLNSSLNDSLTNITILKSDLQSLKSQLNERQTMLLLEKQTSSNAYREKESLQTNVRQLVEVNKKLRDENDTLREMVESNKSIAASPSDLALTSKRSLSRTGSILETYWNHHIPKIECSSPSYAQVIQQPYNPSALDSLDLDSTDELGIHGNKILPKIKLDSADSLLSKNSPAAPPTFPTSAANRNNTMNDSGLSLTTVRDATELESDRDSKSISRNLKQYRSMPIKRNNDNTDSDDASDQNSFDRTNPKRWSQQRSLKRTASNGRSSSIKHSGNKSLPLNLTTPRKQSTSTVTDAPPEQTASSLPFDRMYKVVFCGDAAVGKSTLIMRLCKGKFISNIHSTLGVDFQNKQLELDSKRIAIQLWDTAGQERFRSVAKSYFRRCDGVILVYDATYERSFLNVREWIDTINESTSKKVSVMIVANKIDLRDQMRAEGKRVIERDDGARLAKEYQALFIETSAKDGTNSNETLIELARDMQFNEDIERYPIPGIDLNKTTKKSTCCNRS